MSNSIQPQANGILTDRKLEVFHHTSIPEWGYKEPQNDTFAVLHPLENKAGDVYPLYVVFHSAGHDIYSAFACTWLYGNHDIYRSPNNMYALYLDCRAHQNQGTDWWWGGIDALGNEDSSKGGTDLQPVEKRVMSTIEWVIENYPIDRSRIYAVGNSMGGSGALGIAMRRGDIFAAVKANVPAGVRHFADRCCLDKEAPAGFKLPDPPVLVDYSAQNDCWSNGHEVLYKGMREKKYALLGYWGAFGHANNNDEINKLNDLVHSFDIFSVKLNEAYPVFTNASTDDIIPWENDKSVETSGQVNSFFRWENKHDSADSFSMELRLITESDWKSRVPFPKESTADVSIRRLQSFKIAPNEKIKWAFGNDSGEIIADENGLVTIDDLKITQTPATLELKRAK
ncbi:MAG: prolyl oligopeptidase family serine peptidase [Clostridiales bacterium]|nr:prolyl oligopeptidase family serine peptidase [Clostridiales bacterium]